MSVESIFAQLHDRDSWPAVPERPLVPADLTQLRPGAVTPVPIEALVPWIPAPREDESS